MIVFEVVVIVLVTSGRAKTLHAESPFNIVTKFDAIHSLLDKKINPYIFLCLVCEIR